MIELLRTNDPVMISWLLAMLAEADIDAVVFDTHTSIMDGSISAIPRRIMVPKADYARAVVILEEAERDRRDQ